MLTPSFTKLQRSIITSSIWLEDNGTRLVWITLLALCDRDGIARCSQRGLAHTARVSNEECDSAIEKLLAPDADSRDMGDGRRIERVPGGFMILNYTVKLSEGAAENRREYYREKKAEQRANKAKTLRVPGTKPKKDALGDKPGGHCPVPPQHHSEGALPRNHDIPERPEGLNGSGEAHSAGNWHSLESSDPEI